MCFGTTTPHGGPPFSQYKRGWGFGKRCRSYYDDASMPRLGKHSPEGDYYYGQNRFWQGNYELARATSLGFGDRTNVVGKDGVAPNEYGDISNLVSFVRPNRCKNVTVSGAIADAEQSYSKRHGGPGPAKYNTSSDSGKDALKFSMTSRREDRTKILEDERKPAPSQYHVACTPGKNSPILRGHLYDISLAGRINPPRDRCPSPGPGRYNIKSCFDRYGRPMSASTASTKSSSRPASGKRPSRPQSAPHLRGAQRKRSVSWDEDD